MSLQAAILIGDQGTVKTLLANGGIYTTECKHGSALQTAASIGNEGIIEVLLDHGADVNLCALPEGWEQRHNNMGCKYFVGYNTKATTKNRLPLFDWTLLSWAAGNRHKAVVKLLLKIDSIVFNSKDY